MAARGGKREGAGRKPGSGNKNKIDAESAKAGISPLDYMLHVLRDDKQTDDMRLTAAKAAAPYLHRSLKSVEHSGEGGGPIEYDITISFD